MKSIWNVVMLIIILIVTGMLYRRFEEKRIREENKDNSEAIQNYLLDGVTLGKSKKPILWIHVPYEYNSRNWLSFGSRSSFELNQPYLYLTVRSIITQCEGSFTICLIDDNSFQKLIPGWNINMGKISSPISDNMRKLAIMKLIHVYGGINCPISFLCMKDLIGLYEKGTRENKMFVCENNDRNITSTTFDFYPDLKFCGAKKENETVRELMDFMQRTMSNDFTAQSQFLGDFDRWVNKRIQCGKINMINARDIGTKTIDDTPIKIEDLMSQNYLNLYSQTYGIYIPADDILNRRQYGWFARLSEKQVLECDNILASYILVTIGEKGGHILEPLEVKPDWVGFWKTPLYPGLYSLKPNMLGDNMTKLPYTGR